MYYILFDECDIFPWLDDPMYKRLNSFMSVSSSCLIVELRKGYTKGLSQTFTAAGEANN